MRIKMARQPGVSPIQRAALWRVSSKAEKAWDVLCIAAVVACAAVAIWFMAAKRDSYEGSTALLVLLVGMELVGNQAHRRLRWEFGLQQVWPMLIWLGLIGAELGAEALLGSSAQRWNLGLIGLVAIVAFSYRSVRPKWVDLEYAGSGGLSVNGRMVPWNDVQYYISEYAITLLETGRKFLAELRLSELPLRETAEIKAQLWERARSL